MLACWTFIIFTTILSWYQIFLVHLQCFSHTHTGSFKEVTFTHVDSHTCLEMPQNGSHKHARHSPPMTIVQRPPSCTVQAHALTPPWLCWPSTWGEGACCLMVWIHSPCVKSFPASVTVRSKWGCVGWPVVVVVVEGRGVGRTQQGKHSIL